MTRTIPIDSNSLAFLSPIGGSLMIQNRIKVQIDVFELGNLGECFQIIKSAPFRADGSLLIEFSQIPQV